MLIENSGDFSLLFVFGQVQPDVVGLAASAIALRVVVVVSSRQLPLITLVNVLALGGFDLDAKASVGVGKDFSKTTVVRLVGV